MSIMFLSNILADRILRFSAKQQHARGRSLQGWDLPRLLLRRGRDVHMGRRYFSRWSIVHDDWHLRRPVRDGGLPKFAMGPLEEGAFHPNDRHSAHVSRSVLCQHE